MHRRLLLLAASAVLFCLSALVKAADDNVGQYEYFGDQSVDDDLEWDDAFYEEGKNEEEVKKECEWGWCGQEDAADMTMDEFMKKSEMEAEKEEDEEEEMARIEDVQDEGVAAPVALHEKVEQQKEEEKNLLPECKSETIYVYQGVGSGPIVAVCIVFFVVVVGFLFYGRRWQQQRKPAYAVVNVSASPDSTYLDNTLPANVVANPDIVVVEEKCKEGFN